MDKNDGFACVDCGDDLRDTLQSVGLIVSTQAMRIDRETGEIEWEVSKDWYETEEVYAYECSTCTTRVTGEQLARLQALTGELRIDQRAAEYMGVA